MINNDPHKHSIEMAKFGGGTTRAHGSASDLQDCGGSSSSLANYEESELCKIS